MIYFLLCIIFLMFLTHSLYVAFFTPHSLYSATFPPSLTHSLFYSLSVLSPPPCPSISLIPLSSTSLFCACAALPVSIRCSDVLRPLPESLQRFSSSHYLSLSPLPFSLSVQSPYRTPLPLPLFLSPSGFSLDTVSYMYADGHQLTLNKCPFG